MPGPVEALQSAWRAYAGAGFAIPQQVPGGVPAAVEFFGGGKQGVSALAHQIVAERQRMGTLNNPNDLKREYKSARRSIERYTTEKGSQKRGVSGRETGIAAQAHEAAQQTANAQAAGQNRAATQRALNKLQSAGQLGYDMEGDLHISKRGGHRQSSGEIDTDVLLDQLDFGEAVLRGDWDAALEALEAALFNPDYDGPYSDGMPADTYFEWIDELRFS